MNKYKYISNKQIRKNYHNNTYTFHVCRHERLHAVNIFLVDWSSIPHCNPGTVMSYLPIGGHSEADIDIVKKCRMITKEEYIELSQNVSLTPEEYLQ